MKPFLIISGCLTAAFVIFLIIYNRWAIKQRILGAWVTSTPDGSLVIIQFEGEEAGGPYKQVIKRGDAQYREFGHWVRGMGFIKMIIMATDIPSHPRFGEDTQYNVSRIAKDSFKIDGPDRAKWELKRATQSVRLDFDAAKPTA
jgi:hypothetical protein